MASNTRTNITVDAELLSQARDLGGERLRRAGNALARDCGRASARAVAGREPRGDCRRQRLSGPTRAVVRRAAAVLMSRCTVHENPGASRGAAPLLLDVQAELLSDLATRVVVPLIPLADFGRPVARSHPTLMVSGAAHVMATHLIAAIPRAALGAETVRSSGSGRGSMPSPAASTPAFPGAGSAVSERTALPRRWPIAHRGVATGALVRPGESSQVRCTPVTVPSPSVTAARSAGQASRVPDGSPSSGRYLQRGWKRSAGRLPKAVMPRSRR